MKLEQKKEKKGTPRQFTVYIPEHFRDNSWSDTIGEIQKKIDELTENEYITFDFEQCRWIDPLPLLSLLIEIVRAKKRKVNVDAFFPAQDIRKIDSTSLGFHKKSPNRFLLFLINEGFFSELIKHIPFTIGKDRLEVDNSENNLQFLKKYADISETPCYVDSYFIPVKLYDVPLLSDLVNTKSFAAETVESLLDNIELTLHAKCSAPERRYLLYKLRAILQEFLHNVQEHAYSEENIRLAALYVRYRQGGAVLSSDKEKQTFDESVNDEYINCKQTSKDWLVSRTGCLEVFFLDRGLGIVNHFYSEKEEKKDVFDEVIRETFFSGKSIKSQRKSEYGGLHLLHQLMKRNTDYVRALDDETWIGMSVPFDRATDSIKTYKEVEVGFTGLAYHLRLGWKASTEDNQTWSKFNTKEINQVWTELSKTANECEKLFSWFKQCTIWDERFGKNDFKVVNSEYILWLPKPNRMKWDILNRLEYLSKKISTNSLLIIADIPSIEAATYKAAMSACSFHPNEEWPSKFNKIFLCTNRWSFAYAVHEELDNGIHGFSTFNTENISKNFQSGISQKITGNTSFRELIIHMLKWHDSNILWKEIAEKKRLFIAEEVEWNGDKVDFSSKKESQTMAGYLDFPASTHNRVCRLLYRRALGRVFGFMDENKTELVPVDSLADSVVHDVSYHETYDPPEKSRSNIEKIAIGSVLVSGSTLKSVGVDKNIHCFVHDSFYQNHKDIVKYSFFGDVIKLVKNEHDLILAIDMFKKKLESYIDLYELAIINLKKPINSKWIIAGLNFENKFKEEYLDQNIDEKLINKLNKQSSIEDELHNSKCNINTLNFKKDLVKNQKEFSQKLKDEQRKQSRIKDKLNDNKRNIIKLVLLKLDRYPYNYPALFHWQPIPTIQKVEQKQTRIGKTSEIAPRGWLSIEIPRYSFDSTPIPIGYRSPKETYQDWQSSSPVTVKLGHWCYEGHHDLLTINIPDVVEDAFVRKKPLANFLIGNILAFLGIHQRQLKDDSVKYTNEPVKGCGFQVISVTTNKKREEKAKQFKLEFQSKTNLCAILVVNLPKTPTKRWVYGFNEKNEFICEYVDDVDNGLIIELMKKPACLIKASKLALAMIGRTYLEPGILIYRSHPSSERIMNNVFNCILKEYRSNAMEKVFPILPLRKRFGGSTLLIPPRLQKEIRDSEYKKHIMVFDDASISGRTLQDLRTTLKQLGAGIDDFQIVLIANRLRLPAEAGKIKYFWRMDIPTMGREGTCPLCHGLNQVKSFSTHLVNSSASYDIIKSWLKEWEAVSPIHKWDTGLNSLPIPLEEKEYCYRENVGHLTKIPIYRSIGLSIHTAEIHAMTARDDYGLKKIMNQPDPAVQVEIASSQLLLFGNELDQDLIYDFIVEGLIIPLSNLPDKSPVASLAVLVIIQSLTTVTFPLQKAVANVVKENVTALLNKNHGLILIAYFLANDFLNRNNQFYYEALRLLSTRHASVSEKLRSLFLETLSRQGNIHSKPIPKLISDIPKQIGKIQELINKKSGNEDKTIEKDIPRVSENLITNALDSMASIKDIVSELGSELARYSSKNYSTHSTPSNFSEKKRELDSFIKIARKTLEKSLNLDEQCDLKEVLDNSNNILRNLENVQDQLNLIADLYFFRMNKSKLKNEGDDFDESFKKEIEKIWKGDSKEFDEYLSNKNQSANHIIQFSAVSINESDAGDAEWIWIPWHKHIVTLIRDLLTNVTHSSERISDPWYEEALTKSKANIWVNIKFEAKKVNIYMANACIDDSKKIFEEIEKGTSDKTRWTSLKELGGTIELNIEKPCEKLFCIKISIPYAPFLSSV